MEWNGNQLRLPFVPYNNYSYDQFAAGLEMKQPMSVHEHAIMLPNLMDRNFNGNNSNYNVMDPKSKKRLSNEQLESLENSFQEEIKLDPDRKMKLAKELGLQPRQIAVWFQNRRARWKAKQLERLYDALKQEYDAVSRDKQKLQQEVLALRAVINEQVVAKKQVVYTELSGEETEESTSINPSSGQTPAGVAVTNNNVVNQVGECNYALNVDDYNPVMMPPAYNWTHVLPSNCP